MSDPSMEDEIARRRAAFEQAAESARRPTSRAMAMGQLIRVVTLLVSIAILVLSVTNIIEIRNDLEASKGRSDTTQAILSNLNSLERTSAEETPKELLGVESYVTRCIIDEFAHASGVAYPYSPVPAGCPVAKNVSGK